MRRYQPTLVAGYARPADRTLAGERWIVLEGQFDGPVVRQIDGLPVVVVEEQRADRAEVSGLGEVAPEIEILRHVGGVTEVKAPAEIQQQAFPAGYGSRGESGAAWARASSLIAVSVAATTAAGAARLVLNKSLRVKSMSISRLRRGREQGQQN